MGHDDGALSERFNTTERLGKSEYLQVHEEFAALLETTLQPEGDHATGTLRLLLVNGVLGMALEAGVLNAFNILVLLKHLCESHSILVCSLDADLEGLGATESNP